MKIMLTVFLSFGGNHAWFKCTDKNMPSTYNCSYYLVCSFFGMKPSLCADICCTCWFCSTRQFADCCRKCCLFCAAFSDTSHQPFSAQKSKKIFWRHSPLSRPLPPSAALASIRAPLALYRRRPPSTTSQIRHWHQLSLPAKITFLHLCG